MKRSSFLPRWFTAFASGGAPLHYAAYFGRLVDCRLWGGGSGGGGVGGGGGSSGGDAAAAVLIGNNVARWLVRRPPRKTRHNTANI